MRGKGTGANRILSNVAPNKVKLASRRVASRSQEARTIVIWAVGLLSNLPFNIGQGQMGLQLGVRGTAHWVSPGPPMPLQARDRNGDEEPMRGAHRVIRGGQGCHLVAIPRVLEEEQFDLLRNLKKWT